MWLGSPATARMPRPARESDVHSWGCGASFAPAQIGAVAPAAGAMPGALPKSDQPDQPVPGEAGGTTIARPRTRPEAPPAEDEGPDRRRFWIGLGVAVVLVGAVVGVG